MHLTTSDLPNLELGICGCSCNWGTHMCALYDGEAERDEIIFGFLRQGQKDGDIQIYIPTERTHDDFKSKYAAYVGRPACDGALDRITLSSASEFYHPHGRFDLWHMHDAHENFYADSQKAGPRNVRGTAEMTWALNAIPDVENLMAYESRLNYFVAGKPWISICLYNLQLFGGSAIMNVLRTHPYVISSGVISENPYFQHPDEWLSRNAPQFMRRPAA